MYFVFSRTVFDVDVKFVWIDAQISWFGWRNQINFTITALLTAVRGQMALKSRLIDFALLVAEIALRNPLFTCGLMQTLFIKPAQNQVHWSNLLPCFVFLDHILKLFHFILIIKLY